MNQDTAFYVFEIKPNSLEGSYRISYLDHHWNEKTEVYQFNINGRRIFFSSPSHSDCAAWTLVHMDEHQLQLLIRGNRPINIYAAPEDGIKKSEDSLADTAKVARSSGELKYPLFEPLVPECK